MSSLPHPSPAYSAEAAVPTATAAVGIPPATKLEQKHSRRGTLTLLGTLAAGLVGGAAGGGAATWYWQNQAALPVGEIDIPVLFREVAPSIVGIEVRGRRGSGTGIGAGTGFIVTAEGHVLTNNHVVESADEIHVLLADETRVSASVAGRDAQSDLAVLTTGFRGRRFRWRGSATPTAYSLGSR